MKEEDIRLIKQEIKNNRKAGECGLASNNEKFEWAKTADALEKLLDYITNLQTIEQQYSAILSENAELENKITNLQEENERLKEENKHIFANVNDDQLLRSNAMNYAELQDYKTRNEKAIEYIKSNLDNTGWLEIGSQDVEVLIFLLQGSDE